VRVPRRAGSLAGARRFLRRGRALQRRPALRRVGRARRLARCGLGHPAGLRPDALREAPARDGRPSGPRPRDDAGRRGRAQPVPRRAPRAGMTKFQAPRGTHDVLPRDHLWWRVIRTIEEQCGQYGWSRVSTPGFEETALFERTSGEASDVVHKEMYTFVDRGDRSLTLRAEGAAPIARADVEHGLTQEPQPVKAYAIAPMYRYSRPGRGRYREHWQLSLEAIGSADPAIDAEVIQFYAELLRRLGVTEWEL